MFKFAVLCALIAVVAIAVADDDDANADVTYYRGDANEHGFEYAFGTTNHITASVAGDEHGNIHGDFTWISPEGVHVELEYVSDELGYRPKSDLLPVPPPTPEAILKSLDYIRDHPSHE